MSAREILEVIRLLDLGVAATSEYDAAEIEYVVVTRWNGDGQGGDEDAVLGRLFRQLLREKLGGYPLDEIGAALLADIDSRSADS